MIWINNGTIKARDARWSLTLEYGMRGILKFPFVDGVSFLSSHAETGFQSGWNGRRRRIDSAVGLALWREGYVPNTYFIDRYGLSLPPAPPHLSDHFVCLGLSSFGIFTFWYVGALINIKCWAGCSVGYPTYTWNVYHLGQCVQSFVTGYYGAEGTERGGWEKNKDDVTSFTGVYYWFIPRRTSKC